MPAPSPPGRSGRGARQLDIAVVMLDTFASGLAIARRAVGLGAEVTLLSPPGRWEMHTRGVRAAHELPIGVEWVRVLRGVARAVPEAVVIPGTDRACEFLLGAGGLLPENLRFFERGDTAHRKLMEKDTSNEIARRAGVNVPLSVRIDHRDDLERIPADAAWPLVAKPILGHQFRAFPVTGRAEAERRLAGPLSDGCPIVLSQFIPGGDSDVEEAILVRLADGTYPVSFGVRKLRQCPPGFGETALGESSSLPEATELAKRVLDAAGFVGVAGVEVKRDPRTGERWFLEVNVRVPNQWGLGDACGTDATRRLVAALAGQPLGPQPPLHPGVRFIEVEKDFRLLVRALRSEPRRRWPRTVIGHLRPYPRAGERGVLSLRDPAPAIAMARKAIGKAITQRRDAARLG